MIPAGSGLAAVGLTNRVKRLSFVIHTQTKYLAGWVGKRHGKMHGAQKVISLDVLPIMPNESKSPEYSFDPEM